MNVVRCCDLCKHFIYEEVGDSDFFSVYSEEKGCDRGLDTDPNSEEPIPNFDRKAERPCCSLDFWSVLESDPEIKEHFNEETNENSGASFEKTYALFKRKYNIQQ